MEDVSLGPSCRWYLHHSPLCQTMYEHYRSGPVPELLNNVNAVLFRLVAFHHFPQMFCVSFVCFCFCGRLSCAIEAPFRFSAAHSFVSSRRMKAPFVLSFSMLLRSCILENHGNSSFLGLVSFCIYLFVVSLINLHFPCCCFFFFFFQHAFPLSMKRQRCWSRCPVWNHSAHFHRRKGFESVS